MKRRVWRWLGVVLTLVMLCLSVGGCGGDSARFRDDQVCRVGSTYITISQSAVLICGMQKKYENMFGEEAWSQQFGDGTLDDYIKEQVRTQLIQLASMSLLAQMKDIELNESEEEHVKRAAEAFVEGFSKNQLKKMGFAKEDVQELYRQYALADKVYQKITDSVETEISDDQARMINVQVIFLKTYSIDESGGRLDMSTEERNTVQEKAYQVWQRAAAGENFEALANEYNEGEKFEYHIGRGEMEDAFEEAAFNLASGETSSLVDGKDGIYIIRCLSNYNQAETDANKKSIYEQKCAKVFNDEYDKFMKPIKVTMNEKAWAKVGRISGEIPEVDFLQNYQDTAQ